MTASGVDETGLSSSGPRGRVPKPPSELDGDRAGTVLQPHGQRHPLAYRRSTGRRSVGDSLTTLLTSPTARMWRKTRRKKTRTSGRRKAAADVQAWGAQFLEIPPFRRRLHPSSYTVSVYPSAVISDSPRVEKLTVHTDQNECDDPGNASAKESLETASVKTNDC